MTVETTTAATSANSRERLALPTAVKLRRIAPFPAFWVVSYHLIALLAFLPWFFSWTGVILAILGDYFIGVFGINVCYHRLLTHRGFRCPKWVEHSLAILGFCCLQDTPAPGVPVHRPPPHAARGRP